MIFSLWYVSKNEDKSYKNVYDLWNVYNKVCIDMILKFGFK